MWLHDIKAWDHIRKHSGQTHDSWRILGEVQVDLVVCRFDGKARHEGNVLGVKSTQSAKICRKLQISENCAIKPKSLQARQRWSLLQHWRTWNNEVPGNASVFSALPGSNVFLYLKRLEAHMSCTVMVKPFGAPAVQRRKLASWNSNLWTQTTRVQVRLNEECERNAKISKVS